MKQISFLVTIMFVLTAGVATAFGQAHQTSPSTQTSTPQETASRDATREKVRAVLATAGPKLNIEFKQSTAQPYNFVGILKTGLTYADSFEIVIGIGSEDTIHFRVYPHYGGSYININKAKNGSELARQIVRYSDSNFLFWGADSTFDVFAGYNFTLESGFPEESFKVVLLSIPKLDVYVGQLRSSIDGTS